MLFCFFGREGINIGNETYKVSLLSFKNNKKEILNKSTEIGEQSSPIPAKKEEEKIKEKKKEEIIVQKENKENIENKKKKEKTEKRKTEKQLEEEKVIEKEIPKKTYEKEVAITEKKETNENGQAKTEKNIPKTKTKKEGLSNNQEEDSNIIKSKNGILLVKNNSLLHYEILHMPGEKFPKKARHARLTKAVVVEAIFIVDIEGNTKDIDTKSDFEDYITLGFKDEVEKSIGKYKFSPVYYKGYKVEALFYKKFIFKQN
jgi:outer membrane biosynthesis protein TonB